MPWQASTDILRNQCCPHGGGGEIDGQDLVVTVQDDEPRVALLLCR